MEIPYVRGRVAHQAHVGVPEGTVEEEYARDGFSGRYAHLYRRHAPVNWTRIEGPLRPRAYDATRLSSTGDGSDWIAARRELLRNRDARVLWVSLDHPMGYYFRNADGDEVIFVHEGAGRMETDFGPLAYAPGDYLVIPRGTVYRLAPSSPTRALVVQTVGEVNLPPRGLMGQHALFDPAVIRVPAPEPAAGLPNAQGEHELRVLRGGEITRVFYPHCPVDTAGWKGTLTVWQLNVRDIRPVSSDRYHLPPSAHATFVAPGVIVCTFAPRPLENGDPRAMKVPFFHANVDYDEVIFYHRGRFFSREGIAPGMLTLHPQGIHHGPQPGAVARSGEATHTDEVAVMVDVRVPLESTPEAAAVENENYWQSFRGHVTPGLDGNGNGNGEARR